MISTIILYTSIVQAATITDGPGKMQGDFAYLFDMKVFSDQLYEMTRNNAEVLVGSRKQTIRTNTLLLEYGVLDILSISIEKPVSMFQSHEFSNPYAMVYDPYFMTGTLQHQEILREGDSFFGELAKNGDTPTLTQIGSSSQRSWIGVNFFPFHERFYTSRGDIFSWKLGLHYRRTNQNNFYSLNENERGAGSGSAAWRITGAFSKGTSKSKPYLGFQVILPSEYTHNFNTITAFESTIHPAKDSHFKTGVELYPLQDTAYGHYACVDLFGKFGYQSWQEIPTGVYLPSVLTTAQDIIISQSDNLYAHVGAGVNLQYYTYGAFRIFGHAGFSTPQKIENYYNVSSNGTFGWALGTEFRFRYRTSVN